MSVSADFGFSLSKEIVERKHIFNERLIFLYNSVAAYSLI